MTERRTSRGRGRDGAWDVDGRLREEEGGSEAMGSGEEWEAGEEVEEVGG